MNIGFLQSAMDSGGKDKEGSSGKKQEFLESYWHCCVAG